MKLKEIIRVLSGIILLAAGIFTFIPIPDILILAVLIITSFLLCVDCMFKGAVGKISLIFGPIVGVYAIVGLMNITGYPIPNVAPLYKFERILFIIVGLLLMINAFIEARE